MATVGKAADKRSAWLDVATALAASEDGKKHAEALKGLPKP